MISWLMFIIVTAGFAAPVALATHLTTVMVSRRSYMTIAWGSAIATAAIAVCIWLEGTPNSPTALTEFYQGLAAAFVIVTSLFSGRLIGLMEAEQRAKDGLPIIPG
jgi:hypothetical protein